MVSGVQERTKRRNRSLSGCVLLVPLRFRVGSGPTPRSSSNFLPSRAGSPRRPFPLSAAASAKLAFSLSFQHRPRARVLHPACNMHGKTNDAAIRRTFIRDESDRSHRDPSHGSLSLSLSLARSLARSLEPRWPLITRRASRSFLFDLRRTPSSGIDYRPAEFIKQLAENLLPLLNPSARLMATEQRQQRIYK